MCYWPLENTILGALDFEQRGGGQWGKNQGNGELPAPKDA